jgi:hypothetical protein
VQRRRGSWWMVLALASLAVLAVAGGCSDKTKDKLKDAAKGVQSDLSSDTGKVKARAVAEALRGSLKANKTADQQGVRSVVVLQQAVNDLPGTPTVTGITDGDGDGKDDDGLLEVDEDGAKACLTLPATGEDIQVTSGACAPG